MVWIPSIGDRVVCDGRRPLGRGPYVNDYGLVGIIVQIAPDESELEYYVDPQDGSHPMFTNITQIKRESDGAVPSFLHMVRDLIRTSGPVAAAISIQIFLEHRLSVAAGDTLGRVKELEQVKSVRIRYKRSEDDVMRARQARFDSIRAAAHHVYDNCRQADRIAGGLYFVARSIAHPTIVNSHDPALAQVKTTNEYVNTCRDTFANEVDGVETEENRHLPKKQCNVCYRDVPETSVFKHKGRCTFHAGTRC